MSSKGYGQALYYPYLEFRDVNWFKTAALYYNGLSRIVPPEYEPKDNEIVKTLDNECNFVRNYSPQRVVPEVVDEFAFLLRHNLSEDNMKDPLIREINQNFPPGYKMRLHKDKLSDLILDTLGAHATMGKNSWIKVDAPVAAIYMTCLANKIAEKNNLHVVTDSAVYHPLIQGIQQDFRSTPTDTGFSVAAYVIESVVPKNIEFVQVDQIIEFRDDYKNERVRFYEAVESLVKDAPLISDPEYYNDYVQQKGTIIEDRTDALKHALGEVKIDTANQLLAVAPPAIAIEMATKLPKAAPILYAAGLIFAAFGFYKKGKLRYNIKKKSPWSYVLSLERGVRPKGLIEKMLNL